MKKQQNNFKSFRNQKEELEFYKLNYLTRTKEISKYESIIKTLTNSNIKLQETLQKNSSPYHLIPNSSNNNNICESNQFCYSLKDFKNLWETVSEIELIDQFDFCLPEYKLISNLSQDILLTVYEISKNLVEIKFNEILKCLNLDKKSKSQHKQIYDNFLPFFQENIKDIFILPENTLDILTTKLENIVKNYDFDKILIDKNNNYEIINKIKIHHFDDLMKYFYNICIYMILHNPILSFDIVEYSQRKLLYCYFNKNNFVAVEGFAKEQTPCLILLPPPLLKNKFPFSNLRSAVYIIPDPDNEIIIQCENNKLLSDNNNDRDFYKNTYSDFNEFNNNNKIFVNVDVNLDLGDVKVTKVFSSKNLDKNLSAYEIIKNLNLNGLNYKKLNLDDSEKKFCKTQRNTVNKVNMLNINNSSNNNIIKQKQKTNINLTNTKKGLKTKKEIIKNKSSTKEKNKNIAQQNSCNNKKFLNMHSTENLFKKKQCTNRKKTINYNRSVSNIYYSFYNANNNIKSPHKKNNKMIDNNTNKKIIKKLDFQYKKDGCIKYLSVKNNSKANFNRSINSIFNNLNNYHSLGSMINSNSTTNNNTNIKINSSLKYCNNTTKINNLSNTTPYGNNNNINLANTKEINQKNIQNNNQNNIFINYNLFLSKRHKTLNKEFSTKNFKENTKTEKILPKNKIQHKYKQNGSTSGPKNIKMNCNNINCCSYNNFNNAFNFTTTTKPKKNCINHNMTNTSLFTDTLKLNYKKISFYNANLQNNKNKYKQNKIILKSSSKNNFRNKSNSFNPFNDGTFRHINSESMNNTQNYYSCNNEQSRLYNCDAKYLYKDNSKKDFSNNKNVFADISKKQLNSKKIHGPIANNSKICEKKMNINHKKK